MNSVHPLPVGFYSHAQAWHQLLDRRPSKFESATAEALWRAFNACQQNPDRFKAISAATGSGKSIGAQILLAHLFPATAAIVIREVAECRQAYRNLCELVGANNVALFASQGAIAKYEDKPDAEGNPRVFGHVSTDAEFRAAPIVVCTHKRWKDECEDGRDRGVRLWNGIDRSLVIIDEEPELESVYVAQPEDVSKLASILSDTVRADEARHFDFTECHPAVPALNAVHDRMRSVKDNKNVQQLLPQMDLVTDDEAKAIRGLSYDDLYDRLAHLKPTDRAMLADSMDTVREFLVAACDGRVFFSKTLRGEFYAYSYAIPPQKNTIILDGTADMNGLYGVGKSLVMLDTPTADYSDVDLHYIDLPKNFSGQTAWKPENVRRVAKTRPFMKWFHKQVMANTEAGERVLVYCPLVLIDTDLHNEFDWQGRVMHWQHFGAGRGTNTYKDCTVYFQIRAFYKPKAAIVAQTLSHTGDRPDGKRFRNLSSGRTSDSVYVAVRDTLIACDTKQNAARCCIRHLDDHGKARAARLYFVSDNLTQIERYQGQMFPKSPRLSLQVDTEIDTETATGPERLAHLLATTDETLLAYADLMDATGILKQNLGKSLKAPTVRAVMRTQGWQKVTRKAAGLDGRGYVLTRK